MEDDKNKRIKDIAVWLQKRTHENSIRSGVVPFGTILTPLDSLPQPVYSMMLFLAEDIQKMIDRQYRRRKTELESRMESGLLTLAVDFSEERFGKPIVKGRGFKRQMAYGVRHACNEIAKSLMAE